mmetsp:Transcript_17178/g.51653  ORF Transcript_17178/g.51653 Transcript_17178/m.51653 type:complete len:242 (+) Transcript_17178:110-835(+)
MPSADAASGCTASAAASGPGSPGSAGTSLAGSSRLARSSSRLSPPCAPSKPSSSGRSSSPMRSSAPPNSRDVAPLCAEAPPGAAATVPPGRKSSEALLPGMKRRLLQSCPVQPAPHMHSPLKQRPLLLQWPGHVITWMVHAGPVKPSAHTHFFVSASHTPLAPQAGLQPPVGIAQAAPLKPTVQRHFPSWHWPWPEQVGSAQAMRTSQSWPPHPGSHLQISRSSQEPWPLQQLLTEQSTPM